MADKNEAKAAEAAEAKAARKAEKEEKKAARKAEKEKEKAARKAKKNGSEQPEGASAEDAANDAAPDTEPEGNPGKKTDGPDPFLPKSEEELNKELDGLKDTVQGEIDKMMEDHPDTDWNTIVAAAAEEKRTVKQDRVREDAPLCEVCGKKPAEPDSIYCADCLENMKHYPFSWWQFIVPVVAVMFAALAIVMTINGWSLFSGTANAQKLARQDKLFSALTKYSSLNTSIEESSGDYGAKYLKNQVKIYNKIGIQEYSDLQTFLETYYTGTAINKPWNHYAKKANDDLTSYSDCYTYFSTAASSATSYSTLITAFNKEIKGKDVNAAYANYYRYYACLMYNQDIKTQKKYVNAIAAEGKKYAGLYEPLYAEIALNNKDYDGALVYAGSILERNAEDPYGYVYRGIAYRMQGNLVKAAKALNDGLHTNSKSAILNYQMGVICLINGQEKLAESYANTAASNATTENTYLSACSLEALTAELRARAYKKAGDTDSYDSEHTIYTNIKSQLEENSYTLSDDVASILAGDKTIEQVFTEGTGDFTW